MMGLLAAPVLSEAPALFQNAVSTGVSLGLPDGVKTFLDEGDPVDALATGARSTFGGMAGSYLGGVAQGMGLDWLRANGLQNSALGEIGRQTLGGATFALGDSAVNYFLTPEAERPTADEIGQNIAMAALFSAVNGAVNTAKMTFENKQKLENAVQTVMQDYKTIQSGAQTPEEKITALYEVQEYNKELRTAIAQNRYIGQQEYIDKVLEGLDAVDNAVNVRLKQANMLPIENLAAGAATQANPNGLGADLIGAGTNNITSLPAATENGLDLPLLQGYAGNTLQALLPQAGQPNDFLKALGLTPQQNTDLMEFLRTGDTGKTANSLLISRYLQAFNEGRTGETLTEAAGQSGAQVQDVALDAGLRQDADANAALLGQRTGELAEGAGDNDLFRGDDLLYEEKRPNGISKSHLNSVGDLVPANIDGIYKDRPVTVTEHILGGYRKGSKGNSPYTSFTNDRGIIATYGNNIIKVDLNGLIRDINAGKVRGVEVLTPEQVQTLIKFDVQESEYWRELALKWVTRDKEHLIKGIIPQKYITITTNGGK